MSYQTRHRFTSHGQRPGGADQQITRIGGASMEPARRHHVHGPLQPLESTNPLRLGLPMPSLTRICDAAGALIIVAGFIWVAAAMSPA